MINKIAISKPQPFPVVLKYNDIRSYALTAVFVLAAVLVPWIFHQFHLAGPTFLPMHIFVLIGGLVFGWRAGLIIGLLTPLASYAVSGMPVLRLLPQIVIELSAYGLIAGILREKYNLRAIWSLLGAMVGGRLALLLALLTIYLVAGESYSPLGLETNPFVAFWSVIEQGWPGIAVQMVSIPVIIWLVGKVTAKNIQE
ncbi:MAG: ECF transporter S component [Dehalococcoidia bacterium]|nr:MAG: ECF transporter S component [Dehalococcoidia bacterium]